MELSSIIFWYLIVINVLAYMTMGIDKSRARKGEWRISENTIWMFSLVGGTVGSIVGMNVFRHKTKKTRFKLGLPCLLIVQLILFIYLK